MSQAAPLFTLFSTGPIGAGREQKKAQERALGAQQDAQRQATARAEAEQRRQDMERRRLNRKKPDIGALVSEERRSALTGAGSTLLTGASGVGSSRLTLGSASLLGGN